MAKTKCPICSVLIDWSERYPNCVCNDCRRQACDEKGRLLKFFNTDTSGGFSAYYVDTNERYKSHICYINGVRCYADEAHFGGVVIETDKRTVRKPIINKVGRYLEGK